MERRIIILDKKTFLKKLTCFTLIRIEKILILPQEKLIAIVHVVSKNKPTSETLH